MVAIVSGSGWEHIKSITRNDRSEKVMIVTEQYLRKYYYIDVEPTKANVKAIRGHMLDEIVSKKLFQPWKNKAVKTQTLQKIPPWLILNILRISVFLIAYLAPWNWFNMFNMLWLISTYILPNRKTFFLTTFVMFPYITFEYGYLYYRATVCFYDKEGDCSLHIIKLLGLYLLLMVFSLMYSIRKKLLQDKDYMKKYVINKMEKQDTSILWKFLFYFMINMHLIVLFILLVYGTNQNFQNLGYMLFFIVYAASYSFYSKTNILLAIFTALFIFG